MSSSEGSVGVSLKPPSALPQHIIAMGRGGMCIPRAPGSVLVFIMAWIAEWGEIMKNCAG